MNSIPASRIAEIQTQQIERMFHRTRTFARSCIREDKPAIPIFDEWDREFLTYDQQNAKDTPLPVSQPAQQ